MNNYKIKLTQLSLFFILMNCKNLTAQEKNTSVNQDPKFEQILSEKRKFNSLNANADRYKIQIFSGNNELAKKTLSDFKTKFKNLESTIVFSTPNYKVWVGAFKSRLEAEKNMKEISKLFPKTLLIKPNK